MQTLSTETRSKTKATSWFKTIAVLTLFLSITSLANAQHCDGCSEHIKGPSYVQVGQTVTYKVYSNAQNEPYGAYWDGFGYLYGGIILDEGRDQDGYDFVTIFFYQTAQWSYLTYEGNGSRGYDEIPIYIAP